MLRAEGTYLESVTLSSDFVTLNGYLKNEKFEYSLTDAERSKITLLKTGIILPVQSSYVCLPRGFFPDTRTFFYTVDSLKKSGTSLKEVTFLEDALKLNLVLYGFSSKKVIPYRFMVSAWLKHENRK